MTIASTVNKVPYDGNGSTTVFPYTFRITDEDQLVVVLSDADDDETTLTIDTHYTVSGVDAASGGNVTLLDLTTITGAAILPATWGVTINRAPSLLQGTDLKNQGNYNADTLEAMADLLTMIAQYQQEQLDRCPKVDITSGETGADLITDIEASVTAAELAETNAETAQTAAEAAQTAAETAQTNAETAETNAETAETNAETAQTEAEAAQTAAETAETNAETAQTAAEAAQTAAETAETNAETAETNAETAETNAETAQTAAEAAQGLAETAQAAAELAETAAELAETNAETAQGLAEDARDIAVAQGIICTGAAATCTTAVATLNLPALTGASVGQGIAVNAAKDGYDFVDLSGGGVLQNILKNGSFEISDGSGNFNDWDETGATCAEETSQEPDNYGGDQAVKVTSTGSGSAITQTLGNLKPSTTYNISARVKVTAGDTAKLYTDGADTELDETSTSTSWETVTGTFITDATPTDVVLKLGSDTNGDIVWFDQVCVYELSAFVPTIIPEKFLNATEDGIINMPNQCGCFAYLSSSQLNIADATWTKILLDSELNDTQGEFASNKYTVVEPGFYLISGIVQWTDATVVADKRYHGAIYKNGALFLQGISHSSSTSAVSSIIPAARVWLDTDDYLELYCLNNSGVSTVDLSSGTEATFLSVAKIG